MGELIRTPSDELTGLPLPLIPVEHPVNMDMHHHFHPKKSPLLKLSAGGIAVRNARLQRADYEQHHYDYHHAYGGPELPETEDEQFRVVIMAVAGYMPDFGIGFWRGQPRIARLEQGLRHRLQTSGEVKIGSQPAVQGFIRQYIMDQQVDALNIKPLMIEEFATTSDLERRFVLGHTLLGLITERATEHVDETYYQARQRELIRPGLPSTVRRLTKSALGSRRHRDRMVEKLHRRLAIT